MQRPTLGEMQNKKATCILALFIAPIIGATLGFFLAKVINDGWFSSSWRRVAQPPVPFVVLTAIRGDDLWVRNGAGDLYYNENASSCVINCWRKVDKIQKKPIFDPLISNDPCFSMPPLWGVVDSISECRSESHGLGSCTFALLNNRAIYFWSSSNNEEESFLFLMGAMIAGAVLLFFGAGIFIFFSAVSDWFSTPTQSQNHEP